MNNRIGRRLFLLFAVVLIIFAVFTTLGFQFLFRQHTITTKEQEMEQRAVKIAQTLSESRQRLLEMQDNFKQMSNEERNNWWREYRRSRINKEAVHGPQNIDFYSILRFLNSAAAEDVWIIDDEHNLSMPARKGAHQAFMYKDLPPAAEEIVQKVMKGEIAHSENFSNMLEVPTLTVGAPIRSKEGTVLGVVLVHAPLAGMESATQQGMKIQLYCVLGALILAALTSIFFACRFTDPLKRMQETAEKMTDGDYNARCEVRQKDEIGDLGAALDSLGDRLLDASQESAQLDQLRKDFIANISHELRTPVTVIRGSLEALSDEVITEKEQIKEYYRQMLGESIYLQRLINDLLDLSRLQNVNFRIEQTELNFCDVIRDAARSSRRLAEEKNITINTELDSGMYTMQGDYGRLRQMLLVFLDNAVKFSPSGSTVEIGFSGNKLTISDQGPGISAKDLPHIFDRFYKVRSEQNKSGTGLGLAIAKEIALRHGILVHMESTGGQGTTVVIELPVPKR